jgi:hypothetical protein
MSASFRGLRHFSRNSGLPLLKVSRLKVARSPVDVRKVIQRFRDKYTAAQIKRWYTGLDVAVQIHST